MRQVIHRGGFIVTVPTTGPEWASALKIGGGQTISYDLSSVASGQVVIALKQLLADTEETVLEVCRQLDLPVTGIVAISVRDLAKAAAESQRTENNPWWEARQKIARSLHSVLLGDYDTHLTKLLEAELARRAGWWQRLRYSADERPRVLHLLIKWSCCGTLSFGKDLTDVFSAHDDGVFRQFQGMIEDDFAAVLYVRLAYRLMSRFKEAGRFSRVFDLFFSGNPPLGLTEDNRLVLLTL